ncbi:MAG: MFS transporter [Planctomycetaceae bacterium]|nr:MFS transporter [Planctomycetaceae bacterium]
MTSSASGTQSPQSIEDRKTLFYGWIMLPLAMLGLIATSPGQTYGVMVFTEPIRQELKLTHSQISAAYMFGSLLGAVPIFFVGMLQDRYGLRRTMAGCLILFGGACLITSFAGNWFTLWLSFFLLRCLGPGSVALLAGNTLAFWFHKRLGTVEGIRSLGMACAMAVIPMGNLWLLNELGWRWSYLTLGLVIWGLVLPVMIWLFRNRPEDIGQNIDGEPPLTEEQQKSVVPSLHRSHRLQEAIRTWSFWVILAGTCLFAMIQTGLFFSLVSIVVDRGLPESNAVLMTSAFGFSLAAAHLIGGFLADQLPSRILMSLSLACFGVGLAIFWGGESSFFLMLAGGVLGLSQGVFFGSSNPTWARYFGRDHLGRIRGIVMTGMVASSSLGPFLIGLCKDMTGGYGLILGGFSLLPIPVAIAMLFAAPPIKIVEKQAELEPEVASATA